ATTPPPGEGCRGRSRRVPGPGAGGLLGSRRPRPLVVRQPVGEQRVAHRGRHRDARRLRARGRARGLRGRRRRLQRLVADGAGRARAVAGPRRGRAGGRRRRRPRRVHGLAPGPARPDVARGRAAGRGAARRAGRRLRRRLLPRRRGGVRPRRPAPVHAVRRLARGDVRQHRARRLREDGGPRPQRPAARGLLEPRRVHRGGGVRVPSGPRHPRHPRLLHRADPARADALHLLRRRPGLRRRRRAHLLDPLRRRHPGRPRAQPGGAARRPAHADRQATGQGVTAGLVRAGQAGHDGRLPGPRAATPQPARTGVRRVVDARGGLPGHGRRHHGPVHVGRDRGPPGRRRRHRGPGLRRGDGEGRRRGVHGARQQLGRQLRGLPAAPPRAPAGRPVQQRAPRHGRAAADRRPLGARGGRRSPRRTAADAARRARPGGGDRADRRGVAAGAGPRLRARVALAVAVAVRL
ncbi:MAG: hypothetical protein AVDCRST_MAG06-1742, partial [uncultured Nocardioides sp.]